MQQKFDATMQKLQEQLTAVVEELSEKYGDGAFVTVALRVEFEDEHCVVIAASDDPLALTTAQAVEGMARRNAERARPPEGAAIH